MCCKQTTIRPAGVLSKRDLDCCLAALIVVYHDFTVAETDDVDWDEEDEERMDELALLIERLLDIRNGMTG